MIELVVDRENLHATVNLVGEAAAGAEERFCADEGTRRLAERGLRADLAPHPELPDDTRIWAAMVQASGGIWGGCVYDADAIAGALARGETHNGEGNA